MTDPRARNQGEETAINSRKQTGTRGAASRRSRTQLGGGRPSALFVRGARLAPRGPASRGHHEYHERSKH